LMGKSADGDLGRIHAKPSGQRTAPDAKESDFRRQR
jgi:hypothetical protein